MSLISCECSMVKWMRVVLIHITATVHKFSVCSLTSTSLSVSFTRVCQPPTHITHVENYRQYLNASASSSLCLHSWTAWWRSRGRGVCARRHPSLSRLYPARPYCIVPQVSMATSNWPKLTAPLLRNPWILPGWRLQRHREQLDKKVYQLLCTSMPFASYGNSKPEHALSISFFFFLTAEFE